MHAEIADHLLRTAFQEGDDVADGLLVGFLLREAGAGRQALAHVVVEAGLLHRAAVERLAAGDDGKEPLHQVHRRVDGA